LRTGVKKILDQLPEREKKVISLRYGLADGSRGVCFTLEEIGKQIGVTREAIRQIEIRALKRLHFEDYGLHKYAANSSNGF